MSFYYGLMIGITASFFIGMIVYHQFGREGSSGGVNTWKKVLLSVPFLSLLIFAFLCLSVALIVENTIILGKDFSYSGFLTSSKVWLAVFKELFFAAFIAMVIIVVVEVASTDEQTELLDEFKESQAEHMKEFRASQAELLADSIDKAQRSVFEGVYKNALDPTIFKEVVDTVFKADFVRDEHQRSMVLERIPGNEKQLMMKVRQSYTVRNVTNEPKTSVQRFYLPNTQHAGLDLNRFLNLSITSVSGVNKISDNYPYESNGDDCELAGVTCEKSHSQAEIIHSFPSVEIEGNGCVKVELELQLVKDISDNEILTFLSPTLKGSFSVHSYLPELQVRAISLHRGSLSETPDGGGEFTRWTFDRPMLPYQGYVVMWSPKIID